MNLPASISIFSYANNLAAEFYRILPDVESLTARSLEFTVVMSQAAHQAGVKEVKYSGREWKLSELQPDSRALQSFLCCDSLDAFPWTAGLRGIVLFAGGFWEMTVHMSLQHSLELNNNY